MSRESYDLAQRQRQDQLTIQRSFLEEFVILWTLYVEARSSGQLQSWVDLNVNLIKRWRLRSQMSGLTYFDQVRRLEVGTVSPRPETIKQVPDEALVKSLLTRSVPVERRARLIGLDQLEALDRAEAAAAAAAARQVMAGGRNAIQQSGEVDRKLLGWMRVSDGNPCSFCALVISRGAVYRSGNTAGMGANDRFAGEGMFKFHDNCACTALPVYDGDEPMSDQASEYRRIWDEHIKDRFTGQEARNEFRRILEGRSTPSDAA